MVDRILQIMESCKLSERAFAAQCGLKQNAFWYQVHGQRKISLETIMAILDTYPDISPSWLLLGRGEMYESKNIEEQENRIKSLLDTIATQQEVINTLKDKVKQLQKP